MPRSKYSMATVASVLWVGELGVIMDGCLPIGYTPIIPRLSSGLVIILVVGSCCSGRSGLGDGRWRDPLVRWWVGRVLQRKG